MVSAQDFLKAFSQQWRADWKNKRKAIQHAYQDDERWTAYMLGKKKEDFSDTFLDRLAKELRQKALRERQNLDVVYYTKTARNAPQGKMIRPACMNVIVEHENKGDVEKEMWKLLMWRAPLKVLIFYDWPEWRKTTTGRENWLKDKRSKLFHLGREVDTLCPETGKTTYLFLVGQPPRPDAPPVWWCQVVQGGCWPEQPGKPRRVL